MLEEPRWLCRKAEEGGAFEAAFPDRILPSPLLLLLPLALPLSWPLMMVVLGDPVAIVLLLLLEARSSHEYS